MAEYIERDALLKKLQERDLCLCVSESDIKEAPAADVAPVVHGRWIENRLGYTCSVCNKLHITGTSMRTLKFKFCPYCGAKMDKEVPNGP